MRAALILFRICCQQSKTSETLIVSNQGDVYGDSLEPIQFYVTWNLFSQVLISTSSSKENQINKSSKNSLTWILENIESDFFPWIITVWSLLTIVISYKPEVLAQILLDTPWQAQNRRHGRSSSLIFNICPLAVISSPSMYNLDHFGHYIIPVPSFIYASVSVENIMMLKLLPLNSPGYGFWTFCTKLLLMRSSYSRHVTSTWSCILGLHKYDCHVVICLISFWLHLLSYWAEPYDGLWKNIVPDFDKTENIKV